MCYYNGEYQDLTIDNVNDGWDDCDDGSDESDNGVATSYVCLDGSEVTFELVNDGSDDCADGSDEPVTTKVIGSSVKVTIVSRSNTSMTARSIVRMGR